MDNQHLSFESTSDIEIKEELVESNDEMPWDVDTECSVEESAIRKRRLNSSKEEEEKSMDEEELQSPETIFVQMGYESEEGVTEKGTVSQDPLAQDDENSVGDVAVKKQRKKGSSSFEGKKLPKPGGGSESTKWVCKVCHRTCESFKHLAEHSRTHAGEKPPEKPRLECQVCHKLFGRRSTLNQHWARVHSRTATEKPYECLTCGKWFGHVSYLRTHVRTHTDQRETCETCGKQFANKHSLATHARSHSGEYLYGCTLCSKGFTSRSHYDYHMRKHTGEKPFACAACDKKFAFKNVLARHIQGIHMAALAGEGKGQGEAGVDDPRPRGDSD